MRRGLTMTEVSRRMGDKSISGLHAMLKTSNPRYRHLLRLAKVLAVAPSELLRSLTAEEFEEMGRAKGRNE